ncbi:Beta-Ala-Xaa dipeptidase [Pseudoalteromonas sp. P1-9]|uniref:dipeptidase n=1 Tax=Pseudoalteromonas sp. P1-9 TaxID=1710354 RepID=UPI0006D5E8FD|nr:dipeptidase [Pseudoalteromonas sp. P1-9]KPV96260.1 Beta-Ala-Xaa dipeptidase [Pseudoalteromonas sp. P1-9]
MKFALLPCAALLASHAFASVSPSTDELAKYAVAEYQNAQIHTLANMVSFPTVNKKDIDTPQNPDFIGFKSLLKIKAAELGFDYQDFGHTVLIGMGEQQDKVTIVTHGDVQPADPTKWQQSPFVLDSTSEPGKLIGRGTEDDKGAIATALYAMKALKDNNVTLNNRIELMVYLAEESDWEPLKHFMKRYQQPKYAVTIDASYPVVVAEKGWSLVAPAFTGSSPQTGVYVSELKGGAFVSQIPEDASVVLHNADAKALNILKQNINSLKHVQVTLTTKGDNVLVSVKGESAHSSEPEAGHNAIAHLAEVFKGIDLENNSDGQAIEFINQLIGLDLYGAQFGDIAYRHDFMGPMTVAPTLLQRSEEGLKLSVNLRRPVGKTESLLKSQIDTALNNWQANNNVTLNNVEIHIGTPMLLDDAPHAQALLDIFKHFTGDEDASFVSIGGGTNAKLFDNAVSFGPSMPGKKYTGHSEHEYLTPEQMALNLKMYTAMMVKLGNM